MENLFLRNPISCLRPLRIQLEKLIKEAGAETVNVSGILPIGCFLGYRTEAIQLENADATRDWICTRSFTMITFDKQFGSCVWNTLMVTSYTQITKKRSQLFLKTTPFWDSIQRIWWRHVVVGAMVRWTLDFDRPLMLWRTLLTHSWAKKYSYFQNSSLEKKQQHSSRKASFQVSWRS